MADSPPEDRVAALVEQWRAERPGLDLDTMRLAARVMLAGQTIDAGVSSLAREYGLTRGEGDVVFALRRSGPPYRLSPSRLAESLLVATGTMTNRLDRLEQKGLVERSPNPSDRRGFDVALTHRGRELADEAVVRHVANEAEMLAPLTKAERAELERLLRKLGA
ncbi:MAG: MarR family winged helix-turn-helix transcriptional regulator [Solirubrobacterales bacterium]